MKKRKAVGYARFSSDKQREESIMHQMEMINKYCIDKHIELMDQYIDEAKSGTNTNRDSFQQMMEDAKSSTWDYVIVYKMDRLSRNVMDALSIKKELTRLGIQIISVIEDFDNDTPEGGFFNLISMGMSEFYVANLKREIMAGQMQNAKQAKTSGGRPAYGYSVNKDLKFVINEEEAPAVKIMFQMVADGYSYVEVAEKLNELGYRTRKGRPFHGVFTDYLKNRKYIGEYVYNRIPKRKPDGSRNSHIMKPESEIVRIPEAVPAIIEDEVFEKVQNLLRLRKERKGYAKRDGKYLLSGLIKCDICGYAVSGGTDYGGRNKYLNFSYACTHKSEGQRCSLTRINMLKTDRVILLYIYEHFLNLSNAKEFTSNLRIQLHEFMNNLVIRKNSLLNEIEEIDKQIEELGIDLLDAKKIRRFIILENLNALEEKKSELEMILKSINDDLSVKTSIIKEEIVRIIKKFAAELRDNNLQTRREVLMKIIKQMILTQDTLIIGFDLVAFLSFELKNEFIVTVTIERETINHLKKKDYQTPYKG
ncbi:MAG: recombinase family protein [Acholeplasmataceae bacterium]|nr:recombinase family protein [Acholeplasmataceae bacterium]